MEDYYPDEIPLIVEEYAKLNKTSDENIEEVYAEDF